MIDSTTLLIYLELLDKERQQGLVDSLASTNRSGLEYKGPQLPREIPYQLRQAGTNVTPTQIVSGGYLTPLGKQLADLIASGAADDDYSL